MQTKSSRLIMGAGASLSTVVSSVQSKVTRPTANDPVGAGSVRLVPCSSHSDPNNTPTPRTTKITNPAKPLNTRRLHRLLNSLPEVNAARATTTPISSHDTGGTTTNAKAVRVLRSPKTTSQ